MGKMKELSMILDDTVEIVSNVMTAADALKEAGRKALLVISAIRGLYSIADEPVDTDPEPEPPKKSAPKKKAPDPEPAPEEKAYSKEEVRKYLAQVADKHRDEVKGLLKKYGADNLTLLDPKHYAAIMADAEGIANG